MYFRLDTLGQHLCSSVTIQWPNKEAFQSITPANTTLNSSHTAIFKWSTRHGGPPVKCGTVDVHMCKMWITFADFLWQIHG